MDYKEQKQKYPILAIRLKPWQMRYIRRRARQEKLKLARYVKSILCPWPSEPRY